MSKNKYHGLPTRLLDWSTSLLKELFFAASDNFNTDGTLAGLRSVGAEVELESFEALENVNIYNNKYISLLEIIIPASLKIDAVDKLKNSKYYSFIKN